MKQFQVRFVEVGAAAAQQALMVAESEPALRQALAARGLVILQIKPQRARAAASNRRSRLREYPLFCREIRTLILAGMTVVEAVDTLCARDAGRRSADGLAQALAERLQQGQSLSAALASLPDVPAVLVAAVKAGERTSNLPEALADYLRFDNLVQQLRRKVVSAAIYPALVTALGLGISLFLLLVVMPNFARMYQNLRAAARGVNAHVMALAQLLADHRAATFAVLALVAATLAWWVYRGHAAGTIARAARKLPWLRARIEDFQLAMLYQALALLLKGGYPLVEAMGIATSAALSAPLRSALATARARIAAGSPVAAALAASQLCDEVDRRLLAAAERNGDFHRAAEVVSRLHAERFELFVERATRLVEPLLLLGVALLVGTIVVMMYLPVFDMATRLR